MRYHGLVGIKIPAVEIEPGIYYEHINDILVRGTIVQKRIRWRSGELNQDSVTMNHVLSIIDSETLDVNFANAAYVVWQNRRWVVTDILYVRPRIFLTLGGIYYDK